MRQRPGSQGTTFRRWGGAILSVWLAGAVTAPAKTKPDLTEAWHALSIGFYADAARLFAERGAEREARLGATIAMMNQPPVTQSTIAAGLATFTALAAGTDEVAHAARYFEGRVWQLHPMAPNPAAAERCFEELVATGADDHWCRLALVKLAILRLAAPASDDVAARLGPADGLLARTRDPRTQRALHLVVAEVRLHYGLYDAETRRHLEAALAGPLLAEDLRADLLIQCARLATKLGDPAAARAHYGAFLKAYPKDRRHFTVRRALAALPEELTP